MQPPPSGLPPVPPEPPPAPESPPGSASPEHDQAPTPSVVIKASEANPFDVFIRPLRVSADKWSRDKLRVEKCHGWSAMTRNGQRSSRWRPMSQRCEAGCDDPARHDRHTDPRAARQAPWSYRLQRFSCRQCLHDSLDVPDRVRQRSALGAREGPSSSCCSTWHRASVRSCRLRRPPPPPPPPK